MNGTYQGRCYYCKKDVFHEKPHDFGAFTKKIDKKTKRIILSDVWHMECYVREMNKSINVMRGHKEDQEYTQMTLFEEGT